MKICFLWLVLLVVQTSALAQFGTVSGHVYLADTNAPARTATVSLESVADLRVYDGVKEDVIHLISQPVDVNGSFTISGVPEGSYYMFASEAGYITPIAAVVDSRQQFLRPNKTTKAEFAKGLSQVTVESNEIAAVELRIERGAVISGRVIFDDGSPATGVPIRPLRRIHREWKAFATDPSQARPDQRTDDRGNYRFAGLPGGEYIVEIDLPVLGSHSSLGFNDDSSGIPLRLYTGGVFLPKDAKPVSVKLGEERAAEDLPISLSKFHALRGEIVSAGDGHVLNCCSVWLLRADDKSLVANAQLGSSDSHFSFTMVPEGDYIIGARGQDVQYLNGGTALFLVHNYDSAQQPLHVSGNSNGLTISLTDSVEQPL